jgi:heme/copper-type cytochrome/quinol oxidase subunit 2
MLTIKQARIIRMLVVLLTAVCVGCQLFRPWSDHAGQLLTLMMVVLNIIGWMVFGKIIALLQLEGKK